MPSTRARRRGVTVGLISVVVAAAASVAGHMVAEGASTSTSPAPLPTLPPPSVLEPSLFDSNNCPLMPVAGDPNAAWRGVCGPDSGSKPTAPGPQEWLTLRGYSGSHYAGSLSTGNVAVDDGSVMATTSGTWRARGLVRNQTASATGAVVTANLYDGAGQALGAAKAAAALDMIRPGEPAPFEVSSSVPATNVADVRWSVTQVAARPGVSRNLLITRSWDLPFGDRAAADNLYKDPVGGAPYPYVLAGAVENLSNAALPRAGVVVAWVDDQGRVLYIARAQSGELPFRASEAAGFPSTIASRTRQPFFVTVSDPTVAPLLSTASPMIWSVAASN